MSHWPQSDWQKPQITINNVKTVLLSVVTLKCGHWIKLKTSDHSLITFVVILMAILHSKPPTLYIPLRLLFECVQYGVWLDEYFFLAVVVQWTSARCFSKSTSFYFFKLVPALMTSEVIPAFLKWNNNFATMQHNYLYFDRIAITILYFCTKYHFQASSGPDTGYL